MIFRYFQPDEESAAEEYSDPKQEQESHKPENVQEQAQDEGLFCDNCGTPITPNVYNYSVNKFGQSLCVKCQRGVR